MDALFDFSFSKFLAPKIVGILYGIGIFGAALLALGLIFSSLSRGIGNAIGSLILAPLIFVLYVVMIRIGLEGLIANIKVAQNSEEILKQTQIAASNTNRLP